MRLKYEYNFFCAPHLPAFQVNCAALPAFARNCPQEGPAGLAGFLSAATSASMPPTAEAG